MKITIIVMQQRYMKTISARRRVLLANNTPNYTIQIKRQKKSVDYREKPLDDSRLLIVDPSPKLVYEISKIISDSFGLSSEKYKRKLYPVWF